MQNLTVSIASGDTLDVREFTVTDRMSSLFEITVVATSDNADIDFEAVIGGAASFTIHGGFESAPQQRAWTGLCSEAQQIAVEESGLSTYHITIHPQLWLLSQRRNHRMFQQISELDIVLKILGEWGIEPVLRLRGTYKKRRYRVQYAETDFAFISRMLEDAGISFFFETEGGATKLVLCDAPELGEARAPITFRDEPTHADREHVTHVRTARKVRPGRYTMRDHDYRKDPKVKLLAEHKAPTATEVEQKLERFHYTPGAFLFGTDKGEATPHADDRGKTRTDEAEGAALAEKRLAAQRGPAKTVSFATNVVDVGPGTVTSFLGHPRSDLAQDKKLLVVGVTRHGAVNQDYDTLCEAQSAEQPYRPPLVTPKPKVQGVESATVVGPAGEEIHTDEFGRVRVHFHWDRESQLNEQSSCWIHVSQPWGGAGYGGTNLPRIGQEVIVDFLGGDPDRPIITGRVYTNLQKTPYNLPANKTQSGWKSNSSPTNGGYNELMFEDAAGRELVRMQGEKDFAGLIKHDSALTIGHDSTSSIGHDSTSTVGHDETHTVVHDQTTTVGHNRIVQVLESQGHFVQQNIVQQALEGTTDMKSKERFTIESDTEILIKVGPSTIFLSHEGIRIQGPKVSINPEG